MWLRAVTSLKSRNCPEIYLQKYKKNQKVFSINKKNKMKLFNLNKNYQWKREGMYKSGLWVRVSIIEVLIQKMQSDSRNKKMYMLENRERYL